MSIASIDWDRLLEGTFLGLVFVWGLYVVVESIRYEPFFSWIFPLLVTVPLVVLIFAQISAWYVDPVQSALERIRLDESVSVADVDRVPTAWGVGVFIVTTLSYILLANVVGFFYSMPAYLYAYFRLYDCYPRRRAIVWTLVIWIAVSFTFGTIFNVPGVDFGPFSEIDLGLF